MMETLIIVVVLVSLFIAFYIGKFSERLKITIKEQDARVEAARKEGLDSLRDALSNNVDPK